MNFASHKTLVQRNKIIDLCKGTVYLVEGAVFFSLSDSLASPVKKMSDIPLQDTELEMYDILDIILNISDSFYYCDIIFNSIYDIINKISIMDYKHIRYHLSETIYFKNYIRYLLYYMTSVRYLVYNMVFKTA